MLRTEPYVKALGTLIGDQAVRMAKAGLGAICLSVWQLALDVNKPGQL